MSRGALPPPGRPLGDGTIVLRARRESDLGQLVEACRDPEIPRWTHVPWHYTEADARAYLVQTETVELAFVIAEADDDDRLLGAIGIRDGGERRADLGYWVAAWARERGVATRAVQIVCGWAFAEMSMARIQILVATGNVPSQRVAERAGFTREAVLRSHLETKGERSDAVVFGLLAEDVSSAR